jgi:hypothetical protein
MIWHDMTWHDIWYDMTRHDIIEILLCEQYGWYFGDTFTVLTIQNLNTTDYKRAHLKVENNYRLLMTVGHAAGSTVGWGTALQVGRSRVWFPMV